MIQSDWIVILTETSPEGGAGGKPRLPALSPSWDELRIQAGTSDIQVEQQNVWTWRVGCPDHDAQSKIIIYFLKHSTLGGSPGDGPRPSY